METRAGEDIWTEYPVEPLRQRLKLTPRHAQNCLNTWGFSSLAEICVMFKYCHTAVCHFFSLFSMHIILQPFEDSGMFANLNSIEKNINYPLMLSSKHFLKKEYIHICVI